MFRSLPISNLSSRNLHSQSSVRHGQRNFASLSNAGQDLPSFARGLFSGKLYGDQIFPYPTDQLDAEVKETVQSLTSPMEKFFEEVNDATKNDTNGKIDEPTLQGLRELGAFGLQVPTELGGLGLSNSAYARLTEVIGAHDLGVGITLGAHQSIGFKGILLDGNPQQKEKYLPQVASGEKFAAFALTEPSSGSDANSIKTRAVLSPDGKYYTLNGSKIWISNGGLAEVFTVFAQTEVDDPKNPGTKKDKVSAFIVERSMGVKSGPAEQKMGIKASNTAEVYFEDVKVPVENLLGQPGDGFKVAMRILNNGRFGMSAALSGTMKYCIKRAVEHANQRDQFGNKISSYGLIQEKISKMALSLYATESMAYALSANMDRGVKDYQIEAAMCKIFASEAAWNVCDETIQVLGGMGYMKDSQVERVMRDLRIFRIFEGTNDILRMFVALTGIQTASEGLTKVLAASKSPLTNLPTLFNYAQEKYMKTPTITGVDPALSSSQQLLQNRTKEFSNQVEKLIAKHKRAITEQQFPLQRIANCAIDLYAMAAVMSRATRSATLGLAGHQHERLLAQTFCEEANRRIGVNLKSISDNSDKNLKEIADQVFKNGGNIPLHPLES